MHVEKKVGVLLDGPYSSPPLLVGYDTVLLLGGGSGVAFTLPLMLDLIQYVIAS
jgi:NAD(P)H-flavin reductase